LRTVSHSAHQIFVVALDLGLGAVGAGGAQDHAHALRHFQVLDDFLQALAVLRAGDLARNAAATRGVRHQHRIAAGERQVGGQRRALVAALFLDDLHQQDLAALDDFLDLVLLGSFGFQKRLTIGKWDLIVIRMDFAECKETVAVAAIFDECGLQRWLYTGYPGKIDIAAYLFLVLGFKIKFFDPVATDHDDACFLRVGGVDQHLVGHFGNTPRQAGDLHRPSER
jgi:hypothetical protein